MWLHTQRNRTSPTRHPWYQRAAAQSSATSSYRPSQLTTRQFKHQPISKQQEVENPSRCQKSAVRFAICAQKLLPRSKGDISQHALGTVPFYRHRFRCVVVTIKPVLLHHALPQQHQTWCKCCPGVVSWFAGVRKGYSSYLQRDTCS